MVQHFQVIIHVIADASQETMIIMITTTVGATLTVVKLAKIVSVLTVLSIPSPQYHGWSRIGFR